MATFAALKASVERLAPSILDDTTAGAIVNEAYADVLRRRPWEDLRRSTTLTAVADQTGGTVTLTLGSAAVVGVGTAFDATAVGRYLVVGLRPPLRISTVTDATHLTLAQAWGEPTLTAQALQIISLRYPLPAGAERVLRLRGPIWRLLRQALHDVDAWDPVRQIRGDPVIFVEAEKVAGVVELELWPIPAAARTFGLDYRVATPALVTATDTPVILDEAVRHLARAIAADELASRTAAPQWLGVGQAERAQVETLFDAAAREDRRKRGGSKVVFDTDDRVAPTEPGFSAWLAALQTLGLQKVALP